MTVHKLTLLAIFAYILGLCCCASGYNSYDAVVVEAATGNDGIQQVETFGDRKGREMPVEADGDQCVTSTGLNGTCETVQECFPRLFPLNPNENDTPKRSGVYNQNLAAILLETSGFCGDSLDEERRSSDVKKLHVCCASVKAPEFPLEDEPAVKEEDSTKRTCGTIKIDPLLLPNVTNRIVGGTEAVLGEFPWMVAMLRRGQQFCGGSLIDNKNVLTAAHCVEFMNKHDVAALRLHIGDLDIYSNKETQHVERRARRVLFHKGFTMKNLAHDLALIHLDRPVTFSNTIQPVCLHSGSPPYDTGKTDADVSGWGTTSSGGSQSAKLLAVRIRIISNTECNQKYSKADKKVGPGMVCAGSPGKDSCQGDSGGPLVIDSRTHAKQVGIVSWGIGCASYPGVYTRVDKYMKWINKNKQQ